MPASTLHVRSLTDRDPAALALARASGPHGIYVQNALDAGQHDGLLFSVSDRTFGVAWFGPRGNLVLVGSSGFHDRAAEVADHVRACRWPWRIALGCAAVVDALLERATPAARDRPARSVGFRSASRASPDGDVGGRDDGSRDVGSRARPAAPSATLAHRDQIYYVGDAASIRSELVDDGVRKPVPKDRERLARATLALNHSDLNIPPQRVDRRWLYDTIDDRIREGSTLALGPVGALTSKLDIGSSGPGGTVLEGVFTFPEFRGQGLAAQLVATAIARRAELVSLHVAADNVGARRAYERAGMREAGSCRLLLLG
ncbi:MAG: GNAT family N-acetyltransferase [Planctomycetota bacterium]